MLVYGLGIGNSLYAVWNGQLGESVYGLVFTYMVDALDQGLDD